MANLGLIGLDLGMEDDVSPGMVKIQRGNFRQMMSFVASKREFMNNPALHYVPKITCQRGVRKHEKN